MRSCLLLMALLSTWNTPAIEVTRPIGCDGPSLDVRIFFGYKDARPAKFVGDRYEHAAFVETLVQSCRKGRQACEFIRDGDDAEVFSKTIKGDDGKPRRVLLRVTESSMGPDDDVNRVKLAQVEKSARARRKFLEALQSADAVFYIGHARDGGGPDFSPPRLMANQQVDYHWYRSHRTDFKDLLQALRRANKTPKLLGLFSCFAKRHFSNELRREFPKISLIASPGWLYYEDALTQSLDALENLLTLRCS